MSQENTLTDLKMNDKIREIFEKYYTNFKVIWKGGHYEKSENNFKSTSDAYFLNTSLQAFRFGYQAALAENKQEPNLTDN